MRRRAAVAIVLALVLLIPVGAGAKGYEWRHHAAPFDFLFGNHIDTHQQSLLADDAVLEGFLLITPSGETTDAGVPIVMHGNCSTNPEGCTVGWVLNGRPMEATYCGHVMGDHPAWAIDPDDMPRQRGFTHFHWLNETPHHDGLVVGTSYPGYLLKLTAVTNFVFNHHGQFPVKPGIDFETHDNVFPTCEDWPGYGQGGGGHDH